MAKPNGTMPPPRQLHAHKMVVALALEMTMTTYENIMSNNDVREAWKARHPGKGEKGLQAAFAKTYLFQHIDPARSTLAGMLALPYDDDCKRQIHEALVLDNTLIRGRGRVPTPLPKLEQVDGGK